MANLTSVLAVSLLDKVTAPAKAAAESLRGIGRAAAEAEHAGGFSGMRESLAKATESNEKAMNRLRIGMLEAVAVAYELREALAKPIEAASKLEDAVLDFGLSTGMSGEQLAKFTERAREMSVTVNQSVEKVIAGISALTNRGISAADAEKMIEPIGKAATAYHLSIEQISKAAAAAVFNLKVPIDQVSDALGIMAEASKNGTATLAQLGEALPSLTSAARTLGLQGTKAVGALTAAIEGISPSFASGEEAAQSFGMILKGLVAPKAMKGLAGLHIDILGDLKKAQATGGNPLEVLGNAINKLTQGGRADLVSKYFGKNAAAVNAFLKNFTEINAIYAKSMAGVNDVNEDFARRMETATSLSQAFGIAIDEVNTSVGQALLPGMKNTLKTLTPFLEGFKKFADEHQELIAGVVKAASAIIGLRVAMSAASWATGYMKTGLIQLAQLGLWTMGPVIRGVSAALEMVGVSSKGASRALTAIGSGGLLLGAWFIADNWKGIGKGIDAFGTSLKKALGPQAAADLKPLTQAIDGVADFFKNGLKLDDATWVRWGNAAGKEIALVAQHWKEMLYIITGDEKYAPPRPASVEGSPVIPPAAKPDMTDPGQMGGRVNPLPPGVLPGDFRARTDMDARREVLRKAAIAKSIFAQDFAPKMGAIGSDEDAQRREREHAAGQPSTLHAKIQAMRGPQDGASVEGSPVITPAAPPASVEGSPVIAPAAPQVADGSLFDPAIWQTFGEKTDTAQKALTTLSATAVAPTVNDSVFDAAIAKATTLLNLLKQIGVAAAATPGAVDNMVPAVTAGGATGRTLNSGFHDYSHDNP